LLLSGKGRTTASASGTSIPDAIPIHDDGGQANQGGSSSGDVAPDPVGEPLLSEDDFTKLKVSDLVQQDCL